MTGRGNWSAITWWTITSGRRGAFKGRALAPLRHAEIGTAFAMQNGMQKDELFAATFGTSAAIGAVANFSGELLAAGHLESLAISAARYASARSFAFYESRMRPVADASSRPRMAGATPSSAS